MFIDLAKEYLANYQQKTDQPLQEYFQKKLSEVAKIGPQPAEIIKRLMPLAVKGKRLRGALMVLGSQLAGAAIDRKILEISLVMELIHTGFLIQDDVMDQSSVRRGLPAFHTQFKNAGPAHYGESMAINAGDLTFALGWELLLSGSFPAERQLAASRILFVMFQNTVYGQIMDIGITRESSVTDQTILQTLKYKTAIYTGVSPLLIGYSLIKPLSKQMEHLFTQYGLSLGWAFQLQDDLLGMFGDPKVTGKPAGDDLREGKKTLLVLYVLKHGTAAQKQLLKKYLGDPNLKSKEVAEMQEIIRQSGAYDYAYNLAKDYVDKGSLIVNQLTKNSQLRQLLISFLHLMFKRMS